MVTIDFGELATMTPLSITSLFRLSPNKIRQILNEEMTCRNYLADFTTALKLAGADKSAHFATPIARIKSDGSK
jgi:hypothetical protein